MPVMLNSTLLPNSTLPSYGNGTADAFGVYHTSIPQYKLLYGLTVAFSFGAFLLAILIVSAIYRFRPVWLQRVRDGYETSVAPRDSNGKIKRHRVWYHSKRRGNVVEVV